MALENNALRQNCDGHCPQPGRTFWHPLIVFRPGRYYIWQYVVKIIALWHQSPELRRVARERHLSASSLSEPNEIKRPTSFSQDEASRRGVCRPKDPRPTACFFPARFLDVSKANIPCAYGCDPQAEIWIQRRLKIMAPINYLAAHLC